MLYQVLAKMISVTNEPSHVIQLGFINSLAPGRWGSSLKSTISKLIIHHSSLVIHCEIALRLMLQNSIIEKLTFFGGMVWPPAITGANVDAYLCHSMASLDHKMMSIASTIFYAAWYIKMKKRWCLEIREGTPQIIWESLGVLIVGAFYIGGNEGNVGFGATFVPCVVTSSLNANGWTGETCSRNRYIGPVKLECPRLFFLCVVSAIINKLHLIMC